MKPQEKTFIIVGTSAILLAAGIGGSYLFFAKDNSTASTASTSATSAQATSDDTATTPSTASSGESSSNTTATGASTTTSSGYKEGTYSADTSYSVPLGYSNSIGVSVTIKDGVVTAVKTTQNYTDRESGMYIDSFESSLQNAVVGKSIGSLQLNRIGGATLTTVAFDDALDSIRNDAKV
jgi:uncharacterized protein with FMN-binding domain